MQQIREYMCPKGHGYAWNIECSGCRLVMSSYNEDVLHGYWIRKGVQEHVTELCDIRKVKGIWKDPYNDKGELLCWCLRIKNDVLV